MDRDFQETLPPGTIERIKEFADKYYSEDKESVVIGKLVSTAPGNQIANLDFAGWCCEIKGCRFFAMRLLAGLLLKLNFTPTCINSGDPEIRIWYPKL